MAQPSIRQTVKLKFTLAFVYASLNLRTLESPYRRSAFLCASSQMIIASSQEATKWESLHLHLSKWVCVRHTSKRY